MSGEQTATDRESRAAAGQSSHRVPTRRRSETASDATPLDVIACDGCGRSFATEDGPGMIAVIKGPCPDCGGRFRLTPQSD